MTRFVLIALAGILVASCGGRDPWTGVDEADEVRLMKRRPPIDPNNPPPSFPPIPNLPPEISQPY